MNKNSKGLAEILIIIILSLVVVGGIGYRAYKNGQVRFTPPQKQAASTPTVNILTNWKTFINPQYKYQINYPTKNWEVASASESTILTKFTVQVNDYLIPPSEQKITDMNISILIEKNPNNFTPKEWYCYLETRVTHIPALPSLEILPSQKQSEEILIHLEEDIKQGRCNTNKIKESTFQNYSAIRRTFEDGEEISFLKDNLMFFIRFWVESERISLSEAENYFDQILSTFEFIDEGGTSDRYSCNTDIDCTKYISCNEECVSKNWAKENPASVAPGAACVVEWKYGCKCISNKCAVGEKL